MKNKIITIITMLLTGCGYAPMKESCIITKIEYSKHFDKCKHYGKGAGNGIGTIEFKFYDTCGKFQIGDTINFIKK